MKSTRILSVLVAAAVGIVCTACGSDGNDGGGSHGDPSKYMSMSMSELVKAAQDEGTLTIYTSNTSVDENAAAFEKKYGVKVKSYRAKSPEVLQRVLQEAQAGKLAADVIGGDPEDLVAANKQDVLANYSNPRVTEELRKGSVFDGWVSPRYSDFVVAWNTDKVSDPPTTWEDLTDPKYKGKIVLESADYAWYMTLHTYFTDELGWSADKADSYFKKLVDNSVVSSSHTIITQMLDSGQVSIGVDYAHLVKTDKVDKGAPITFQPIKIEPVIRASQGLAVSKTAPHPAAAVLYMDWALTDGQKLLVKQYRTPANAKFDGPVPDGVKTYEIPVEKLASVQKEWSERWDNLLRGHPVAGGE